MKNALSPELHAFVAEIPLVRRSILRFVRQAAEALPMGSRVLDAGAGDAPYRELFSHCDYLTTDLAATTYHDFSRRPPNIVCDLTAIPLPTASLDAILCTEVLEHVPEPTAVLAEFRRLLMPGGQLFLTTPFFWGLHEQPYDFYRFTPYALERLFTQAGFAVLTIRPRDGFFTTVAMQLIFLRRLWPLPSSKSLLGRVVGRLLRMWMTGLSRWASQLDRFDNDRLVTLGYMSHCIVDSTLERAPDG